MLTRLLALVGLQRIPKMPSPEAMRGALEVGRQLADSLDRRDEQQRDWPWPV